MAAKTKNHNKKVPADFASLNVMLPLRPIADRVDLDNAMEVIDAMAGHDLNEDQSDYLEVLSTLVERYEAEHDPIDTSDVSPLDVLTYLLEANEMNASDLGRLLGNRSLGAKILNGTRELSKANIRVLAERFKINPGIFV